MKLTEDILNISVREGTKIAVCNLEKFINLKIQIQEASVYSLVLEDMIKEIEKPERRAIIIFGRLLSGIPGASILIMSRKNALILADCINKKNQGETRVLDLMSRSALKEFFNILVNSFMNPIAKYAKIELGLDVPRIVTEDNMKEVLKYLIEKGNKQQEKANMIKIVMKFDQSFSKFTLFTAFNYDISSK